MICIGVVPANYLTNGDTFIIYDPYVTNGVASLYFLSGFGNSDENGYVEFDTRFAVSEGTEIYFVKLLTIYQDIVAL